MKSRKATFSLTCCLTILVCVFLFIDLQVHRQPTNTHLHLYYSYFTNGSGFHSNHDATKKEISFISIFNQSSDNRFKATTLSYYDKITRIQPDFPTTTGETTGSRAHIIAIVSYMRSGSTLTGDILQHFPGSMYVFEPFHSLVLRARTGRPLFYLDGTVRKMKPENITNDVLREELKKWFECRYGDLDVHSLTDSFHKSYSRSMMPFYRCWQPKPRTLRTLRECLPKAIEKCQNAKYRLFKFIRLPMPLLESVIDMFPRLQTIHLIRDPRGALSSQIKVNNFTWDRIGNLSKHFCERVSDDLNATINLNRLYPNRAKILLYENLAENPLSTAEKLHRFTNMPHYDYVMKYITKLTMRGRKSRSYFGSQRANSTRTAYKWRDNIEYNNVQTIDGHCSGIYDFIGYQKFSSEKDVRDHFLPTMVTPNSTLFI